MFDLNESARQLEQAGYPAQFRSLGNVGHTYVGDAQARAVAQMCAAVADVYADLGGGADGQRR